MAERLARETPGSFFVNQFGNPANPYAHETTTGPEIGEQRDHKVDAVVCGVGSAGTMTGLSRYFARVSPDTEMVLADPVGSVLAEYVRTGKVGAAGSWIVDGIVEDYIHPIAAFSRLRKAYSISDEEACTTVRELLRKEGILAGSSSGTLIAAALRYCREQTLPRRVVTFVCDSGNKYLSKVFNDYWLMDQGFLKREQYGDLRDLITRRHEEHATVTVGGRQLMTAYARMKLYDVSQLPVLEDGKVVGIMDEWDLLTATENQPLSRPGTLGDDPAHRDRRPEDAADAIDGIQEDHVAIVVDNDKFYG